MSTDGRMDKPVAESEPPTGQTAIRSTGDGSPASGGTGSTTPPRAAGGRYDALAQASPDGVLEMDANSVILSANPAAERIFGFTPEELVGQSLSMLIPERLREAHRRGVERYLSTRVRNIPWTGVELPALTKAGSEISVEIGFGEYVRGEDTVFVGYVRNITERKRSDARRAAEHAVTRVLAHATSLEAAVPDILKAVVESVGWEMGAFWILSPESDSLRCADVWTADPSGLVAFERKSREIALEPGRGLPGRVWESGRAVWITDLTADPTLPRLAAAAAAGFETAFAFPVTEGHTFVGVMEFFTCELREADTELLRTMEAIGSEIAQFAARRYAEAERDRALADAVAARRRAEVQAHELEQQSEELEIQAANLEESHMEIELHAEDLLRAREEAERNAAHLAAVLDSIPMAVWIADGSGRITHVNRAAPAIWGTAPIPEKVEEYGQYQGRRSRDGAPIRPEEWPLARAIRDGETTLGEMTEIDRADGSRAYVLISAAPVRASDGSITGAVAAAHDVTAQRTAQIERDEALQQANASRDRLERIFSQAPVAIATTWGPEHVIASANRYYLPLVGRTRDDELLGRPVREALAELEGQGFFELLDQVYATGEAYVGTEVPAQFRRAADGGTEEVVFNFVYQPLIAADGRVEGICALAVDVTDLVRARQEAEGANRAKSSFLATMSHELRTPLNAMIGYAELMAMGIPDPISGGQREQVERIRLSALHLLQLIEEILTYTRVEAGREGLHLEPVTLAELALEVRAIIEPLAGKEGLTLVVEVPREPVTLLTDPRKVRQILLNLLGNAVKFTREGSVTFHAERDADQVVFTVQDTGIGIEPEDLERVFEAFWQAETEMHSRVAGTGLGLPVTQRLTELLGGTVAVESTPGVGTTFRVRLPIETTASIPEAPVHR